MTRHARHLIAVLALLTLALPAFALSPDALHLRGATLLAEETPPPARFGREAADDLHLIRFDRALGLAVRTRIESLGGEIMGYLPVNGYLLRVPAGREAEFSTLPGVDIFTPYRPEWRLAPRLLAAGDRDPDRPLTLALCFAPGEPALRRADEALALGAELVNHSTQGDRPLLWLRARPALLPELLEELASLPGLLWLESTGPIVERNDRVSWIVQSGADCADPEWICRPVWERGIHGEGQVIGHIDSDIEPTVCFFADPEGDPPGPDHRKLAFHGEHPGTGYPSHGTHTAGTLAGDAVPIDAGMGETARGLAWAARLAHSSYSNVYAFDPYVDFGLHADAGARVHSNSYGVDVIEGTYSDPETRYILLSRSIDLFSRDREENLVVFAATNKSTLRAPENAKNVLAVGASWTHGYVGGGYKGPNEHRYGGLGPTDDGRRKPEIYAPGASIYSAGYLSACATRPSSGTSMACPTIAAGATLVRQYLTEGFWPGGAADPENALTPSGALLKALMLNSTLPMDSTTNYYNYPPEIASGYPNDLEGWGRLLLDEALYFDGDSRELWIAELRNAAGMETGEEYLYHFEVQSADEPLAITLAFTDFPGELLAAEPVVNDIDLSLEGPGGLFLGNVFDTVAEESMTGGAADPVNTVERIIVKNPTPGAWTIRVRAAAVPMGPQGYAIAMNGDLTGIVEEIPPAPKRVRLTQNYPNPFVAGAGTRSVTTLAFELPCTGCATLKIFDVSGRLVRTLAEGDEIGETSGELTWDGRNDAGENAASGIYFARLETDRNEEKPVVRIVLLR